MRWGNDWMEPIADGQAVRSMDGTFAGAATCPAHCCQTNYDANHPKADTRTKCSAQNHVVRLCFDNHIRRNTALPYQGSIEHVVFEDLFCGLGLLQAVAAPAGHKPLDRDSLWHGAE